MNVIIVGDFQDDWLPWIRTWACGAQERDILLEDVGSGRPSGYYY